MVRGWERRVIFADDTDRDDVVTRVAALAKAGAWQVFAWALLPNHAHLLVRTDHPPLPRSMRSLLMGSPGPSIAATRAWTIEANRPTGSRGAGCP
jgi:REP element-mobilizing transposase RayT